MSQKTCPCCGQAVFDHIEEAAYRSGLSPSERRLFLSVAGGKGHPVSIDTIWNDIWGFDPNGGPDCADVIIRRYVCTGRKKIASFGLGLECVRGVGYRLVTIAPRVAA